MTPPLLTNEDINVNTESLDSSITIIKKCFRNPGFQEVVVFPKGGSGE